MTNQNQLSGEAADLLWDIAQAVNLAHDEVRAFGGLILDSFQADQTDPQKKFKELDALLPDLRKFDTSPLAATVPEIDNPYSLWSEDTEDDSILVKSINEARRMVLGRYLKWEGPIDFDRRPSTKRVFGEPQEQTFLDRVRGKVVVTQHRGNSLLWPGRLPQITPAVYLVGGLDESCVGKKYPNPDFKVMKLLPGQPDENTKMTPQRELELIVRGRERLDADQLGFISNVYFRHSTFKGPYERAIGHALCYECTELGDISVPFPESGNPEDIQIDSPKTPADHLVLRALANRRLLDYSARVEV